MKRPSKLMLIVAVALICLVVSLYTLWTWANSITTIPSSGTIIYPATITSDLPTITWGDVLNGTSISRSVTLTNTGDLPATLVMTSDILGAYGFVTWDREGYNLTAHTSVLATFTFNASSTAPAGAFDFNIYIQG